MTQRIPLFGLFIAIATILFSVESLIPIPMPWFRIGLANIITLLVLIWWGFRYASVVLILRILIGSMLIGKLFQPAFFLSLTGGISSLLAMSLAFRLYPKYLGLIGVSVMGAVSHNLAQIILTYFIYIRHSNIFSFIPFYILAAIVTGCFIGSVVILTHQKLDTRNRPFSTSH